MTTNMSPVIKDLIKGLSDEPVKTPSSCCPYCGCKIDCATGSGTPEPNSIDSVSLCLKCYKVLLFNDDLTVRKPTDTELAELEASEQWSDIQKVINALRRIKA